MTSPLPPSAEALLSALAAEGGEVSLPRLCKRLGLRMSVLLRLLAALGDTPLGDAPAPGYVIVRTEGERQFARISDAGLARLARGCGHRQGRGEGSSAPWTARGRASEPDA